MLILASIYLRFCIYYIDVLFLNIKNPTTETFDEELKQHNSEYFFNLFSFLFFHIRDEEIFSKKAAFIPFLYLPINEILFFIVGIALISLGYKFKLRFDIIIIISFILIYLFKLIIFLAYLYRKNIYSTLYFFLHGYGILMLTPIFNFPSFLIGMYFGLVNFTIQKGIHDLNEYENFNNELELVENERISSLKENKTGKFNNFDLGINDNSNNDTLSKSLTYNKANIIEINEDKIIVNTEYKKSLDEQYEKAKKNLDINKPIQNDDILMEMPFLKTTVDFTNFHRKNQDKKLLKIILSIFIILNLFFIFVRYTIIYSNILIFSFLLLPTKIYFLFKIN